MPNKRRPRNPLTPEELAAGRSKVYLNGPVNADVAKSWQPIVRQEAYKYRREQLAALREEVRKQHKRASDKISRNRREKGIQIANTSVDPRTNAANIAKYTAKQLLAYNARLKEFTARNTQFVPGVEGTPIPRHKWNQYKRAEAQHNSIGEDRMNGRGHLKAPGSGMTIREREDSVRSKIKARGSVTNRPFGEMQRESIEVNGVEALDKLIADIRKKNRREFIPATLAAQREQLNQMLTAIGNDKWIKKADKLTDHQFDVLFNDTNFTNTVSQKYWIQKALDEGNGNPGMATQEENADSDIRDFFRWAKKDVPESRE